VQEKENEVNVNVCKQVFTKLHDTLHNQKSIIHVASTTSCWGMYGRTQSNHASAGSGN